MNIILTGFMGSGKTAVGKRLAKKLNMKFVDLDKLIVKKEGRSINDIFTESGEKYFREIETAAVIEISAKDNIVLSTGGGVVLKDENMDVLGKTGKIIYLRALPEIVYKRVKRDKSRPLLKVDDPLAKIKELLEKREKYYKRNDYEINTTDLTIDEAVDRIIEIM
ncbi:MAG: shikimate kinase [Elusimicrobiota bacterium]